MIQRMKSETPSLNEWLKEEWRDICFKANPDLTEEEFEVLWKDFQVYKEKKGLQ